MRLAYGRQSAPSYVAGLSGFSLSRILRQAQRSAPTIAAAVGAVSGTGSWLNVARTLLPGQVEQNPQPQGPPPPRAMPAWLLPVGIGAVVLVGVLAMSRRR